MDTESALQASTPTSNPQLPVEPIATATLPDRPSSPKGRSRTSEAGNAQPQHSKRRQLCRFYATSRGCRAGDACPFLHDSARVRTAPPLDGAELKNTLSSVAAVEGAPQVSREPAVPQALRNGNEQQVSAPRAVQKPVSQLQTKDPRAFQISQVKTRFAAREEVSTVRDEILLLFKMTPSDPDFPFDIVALECTLRLPSTFPHSGKPTLRVTNKEMERGYQLNVEKGFDAIWAQLAAPTLLNAMNVLDKRLETLLTAQKAETIKIIVNAGAVHRNLPQQPTTTAQLSDKSDLPPAAAPPAQSMSTARREQALAKRKSETQALEHRLGSAPQFSKAADGTTYSVPLDPRKRAELPAGLQAVKAVRLSVPLLYDVEPCSIKLLGAEGPAAVNVEKAFARRVEENREGTLLAQLNWLAQNMHIAAVTRVEDPPLKPPDVGDVGVERPHLATDMEREAEETDKSHIKFIPRPSEWTANAADSGDGDSSDDSEYSASEEEDTEGEDAEEALADQQSTSSATREKGILISFPSLELYGIELLELTTVTITVKCKRCKDTMDVPRIKNNERGDYTGMRTETCKKCAFIFGIGYRKDLMHANSTRAGYLDLEGCTVVDLLPSVFIPTCSDCSTSFTNPGVVAVRGDAAMAICRECHRKMVFRIPDVKFLVVGTAALRATRGLPRKKPKENLGIVAGQELPKRGRCSHYGKSYRWFRFSCCSKVFPCDKCHDEASDHPNEFANRMICGFCSREQNYRPEDCGVCRSPLTGKAGSGFWEGGKGTRDRLKMSRKDPRKYKRRQPTAKPKG